MSRFNPDKDTLYIINEQVTSPEDSKCTILQESVTDGKDGSKIHSVTIDTVLQSFEKENLNGRIYGKDVVMDAIDNDLMIQTDMKHNAWVGEYGHPLDVTPQRQVVFDPARVSHRILSYKCVGNLLTAVVETLAGDMGNTMRDRILQGIPAAFSLRSLGSVDLTTRRVKSPLKVITYDCVFRPSHTDAYEISLLKESAGLQSIDDFETIDDGLFVPITESFDEISELIMDRSINIQKVADMFNIDDAYISLIYDGRANMVLNDSVTLNVPIESAITLQYSDILNTNKPMRLRRASRWKK